METVKGVVEAVGTKFNGSVKLNGEWKNLKKGVKNTAKVGDTVELSTEAWDFKGRQGVNVTEIKVLTSAPATAITESRPIPFASRDFDKENRGKTKCALLAGLLANPSVNTADIKANEKLIDAYVEYVFGE